MAFFADNVLHYGELFAIGAFFAVRKTRDNAGGIITFYFEHVCMIAVQNTRKSASVAACVLVVFVKVRRFGDGNGLGDDSFAIVTADAFGKTFRDAGSGETV